MNKAQQYANSKNPQSTSEAKSLLRGYYKKKEREFTERTTCQLMCSDGSRSASEIHFPPCSHYKCNCMDSGVIFIDEI